MAHTIELIFTGISSLMALICALVVVHGASRERIKEIVKLAILEAQMEAKDAFVPLRDYRDYSIACVDRHYRLSRQLTQFRQWFAVIFTRLEIKMDDLPPEEPNGHDG